MAGRMANTAREPVTTNGSTYPGRAPLIIIPANMPVVCIASSRPKLPPILSAENRFETVNLCDTMNVLSPKTWNSLSVSTLANALGMSMKMLHKPEKSIPR